jgi:hypothetical protein
MNHKSIQSMVIAGINIPLNKVTSFSFIPVLMVLLSASCRKDKSDAEIENVTGFTWTIYAVQETNDGFMNPVPTSWHFQLNKNRSFSFDLSGAKCSGSYTWSPIDPASATISFAIKEWNNPSQSSTIADKLKKFYKAALLIIVLNLLLQDKILHHLFHPQWYCNSRAARDIFMFIDSDAQSHRVLS